MKKGFTLAEILIVLTIIGVMAVMTIPSLVQNSNSQQKITLFKKGFNAVTNAYATEFAVKSPPKNSSDDEKEKMWNALNNQLNVKYYIDVSTGAKTKIFNINTVKELDVPYRVIVTEDGIGYAISANGSENCKTKLATNEPKNSSDIEGNNSCMTIGIFLDGKYIYGEQKYCSDNRYGGDGQDLNDLKCDTIWFPVTSEGITAGNSDCVISGRIISGVNPRPASCDEE